MLKSLGCQISDRLINEAVTALKNEEYDRALSNFETALRIDRHLNRQQSILNCLLAISHIHNVRGKHDLVLVQLLEALSLSDGLQDREMQVMCLREIGKTLQERGEYSDALDYFEQALAIVRTLQLHSGLGDCLRDIGRLYRKQGNQEAAAKHLEEATAVFQKDGDVEAAADCMLSVASIQLHHGDVNIAHGLSLTVLDLLYRTPNQKGIASALYLIAQIYDRVGDKDRTVDYCRQALHISENIGDDGGVAATCTTLSKVEAERQNYSKALTYSKIALEHLRTSCDPRGLGNCLRNRGILSLYLGAENYLEAIQYLSESISCFEALNDIGEMAESLVNLGQVYLAQNDLLRARETFIKAIEFQERLRANTAGGLTQRNTAEQKLLDGYFFLIEGVLWKCGEFTKALSYVEQTRSQTIIQLLDTRKNVDRSMEHIWIDKNARSRFYERFG